MIAVIDYGFGNLGSIVNMFKAIGEKAIIANDSASIDAADKLVLPGVGAFDAGMEALRERKLVDVIWYQAKKRHKPILGICLGMQLLGRRSDEGNADGLGLIPFECKKIVFADNRGLKVPHMGWDIVNFEHTSPLTDGLNGTQRYYFVHSYHAVCDVEEDILMTCDYGYRFTVAVEHDNLLGVQFHPEKSHNFGMALLKNFIENY